MPSISITATQPFDFDLTASHQTHYRGTAGADVYEDGVYYRALRRDGRVLVVAVSESPDARGLDVALPDGASEADLAYVGNAVASLLGFDADLAGFYDTLADDPVLASTAATLHGLRPTRTENVFEALVTAVVGQQISGAVARVIRDLLVRTFGTRVEAYGHTLFAFPTPQVLAEAGHDELRAMKLSNRKAEYIHDVAIRTLDGTINDSHLAGLDDDEVVEELVRCRGIGRWTAEWMLIRALGRPDVMPAGDLALKRVVSQLYFGGADITEPQLVEFGRERWSPYRGLATTYLFSHLRRERAPNVAGSDAAV